MLYLAIHSIPPLEINLMDEKRGSREKPCDDDARELDQDNATEEYEEDRGSHGFGVQFKTDDIDYKAECNEKNAFDDEIMVTVVDSERNRVKSMGNMNQLLY